LKPLFILLQGALNIIPINRNIMRQVRQVRQTNKININLNQFYSTVSRALLDKKQFNNFYRPLNWGQSMNNYKYTLTRKEFADHLGITTDTLKKQMKRGHHKGLYVLTDGKYLFTTGQGDRPITVTSPVKNVPVKKRNRGNHLTSKNPKYNNAFKKHNELKMLARLQGTQDKETLEVLPRAVELAKKEKQKNIRRRLEETTPKNYGGMINRYNSAPLVDFSTSWTVLDPKPKDEYQKYLEDNDLTPGKTKSYY
jgi:hypothetical protein